VEREGEKTAALEFVGKKYKGEKGISCGKKDGCYSRGDSQGLPGFIHPRVLGIPTISFQ